MPSNVHHQFEICKRGPQDMNCRLGISERQGEARGAARAEAHGPGPRDEAECADRVHQPHSPPHVQTLSEGDNRA